MKSIPWLASTLGLITALVLFSTNCAKADSKESDKEKASSAKAAKAEPGLPTPSMPANLGAGRTMMPKKAGLTTANEKAGPMDSGKKDQSYQVKLDVPGSVAKDAQGVVRVTIVPSEGWKMNKEFPTRLKVQAPEGVSLAKEQQSLSDAEKFADKELTFAIRFTPASTGKKSFNADFRFAVCTDATCDPKKEKLAWAIDVK